MKDQEFLLQKLKPLNCRLQNYNFVVLYIYRLLIHFQYAVYHDFVIIKTTFGGHNHFLFPIGKGDISEILEVIKEEALKEDDTCRFLQFCDENAKIMLQWAMQQKDRDNYSIKFYDMRGDFEYIYLSKDLANLDSHALKSKRNHVHKFQKLYQWRTELITKENLEEVRTFSHDWTRKLNVDEHSRLIWENQALEEAFDQYFQLALEGLILRVEEKIVGFSFGCPLCDNTFLVLFEQADRDTDGSYAMLNKQFASTIGSPYTYLNRAEDVGNEGLRKAKMSYHPHELQKVYHLDIKKIDIGK